MPYGRAEAFVLSSGKLGREAPGCKDGRGREQKRHSENAWEIKQKCRERCQGLYKDPKDRAG